MLATFMEVLDTSVANVSLPHIAGDLSAGVDESTWVLTSYLVSNAIVLPLTGWLSSVFGRKRFYMTCVAIFTISSFLCGIAPSLGLLVFFRVIQGAGGGALQPISQAILVESFPKNKTGMAMAIYGMGVVVAPIIGPTLGGWITDDYSWHWIFFINIPVGILSLVLTTLLIHDPPYLVRRAIKGQKIDYTGLGLLAVGLGFLQVVLDKGEREDWFGSNFIIWCTILGVVGLVGAVVWELSKKDPIVDFRMLTERNFAIATFTMFMLGFVLYGSTVLLPIFLQTLMGYTALLSGLVLSPGGFATLLILPFVGRLSQKIEARWLVTMGLAITGAALLSMSNFNLDIDFWTALRAWTVSRLGLAILFVPINVMAFYYIPKEKMNNATGLINLARNIGGSVGIANVTTLLARRAQIHQSTLVSHVTPLDAPYQAAIAGTSRFLMQQGSSATQAAQQAQGLIYGNLVRQSTMLAFIDTFWLLGLTFLAMIPLMFLMKTAKPHGASPADLH
ncbi:MAG: DHA2 family efflux MFS transporter permease subunit [Acidobacteria bacterium]|nr:DHA2 family efflux MFS transporter permease subunit [Acidobacteriota bacterium]